MESGPMVQVIWHNNHQLTLWDVIIYKRDQAWQQNKSPEKTWETVIFTVPMTGSFDKIRCDMVTDPMTGSFDKIRCDMVTDPMLDATDRIPIYSSNSKR